jgi:hypothetical protein
LLGKKHANTLDLQRVNLNCPLVLFSVSLKPPQAKVRNHDLAIIPRC